MVLSAYRALPLIDITVRYSNDDVPGEAKNGNHSLHLILPLKGQPLDPSSVLKAQRPGKLTLLLRRKIELLPVAELENDPGIMKW